MNQTINHPDYGPLTIGDHLPGGRSRLCKREDGTTVTLSSRAINKLRRLELGVTPVAPEEFVASVDAYLRALRDGPTQAKTARDVWELCDRILEPARYEPHST